MLLAWLHSGLSYYHQTTQFWYFVCIDRDTKKFAKLTMCIVLLPVDVLEDLDGLSVVRRKVRPLRQLLLNTRDSDIFSSSTSTGDGGVSMHECILSMHVNHAWWVNIIDGNHAWHIIRDHGWCTLIVYQSELKSGVSRSYILSMVTMHDRSYILSYIFISPKGPPLMKCGCHPFLPFQSPHPLPWNEISVYILNQTELWLFIDQLIAINNVRHNLHMDHKNAVNPTPHIISAYIYMVTLQYLWDDDALESIETSYISVLYVVTLPSE